MRGVLALAGEIGQNVKGDLTPVIKGSIITTYERKTAQIADNQNVEGNSKKAPLYPRLHW